MPLRKAKQENIFIGQLLKKARVKAGYSQKDIAEALELSQNHVSELERGISAVSVTNLLGYCDKLKISPNDILEFDKNSIDVKLQGILSEMSIEEQQKIVEIINIIRR